MKKVLITGAGAGIGLACVELFLKQGYEVFAHYRQSVDALKKLQGQRGQLELIKADFSKKADLKKFLLKIKKIKLNALVNNAGDYDVSLSKSDRIESVNRLLMVNAVAPVLIAETVLEQMKTQQSGHIVNVSSVGVKFGSGAKNIFYGVSKGGLEVATRTLAREGAPYNILVNSIRPGVTDTNFHAKAAKNLKERAKLIPLKRIAKPEEIARLIVFLCTQNSYITKEVITIAGGE